jgi:hypothetical protein
MACFRKENGAGVTKRLTVTFIVLILLQIGLTPSGQAQIFSCVTKDGKRFFTDDPTLFPPDCRKVTTNEKAGDGGLSIVDSPSPPPAPVRDLLIEINEGREQQSQHLEEWKKTAVELVSEYKAAQTRLYRATRARTRSQIRQEIHDIKARRDALLANVAAAKLSFRDRGTVEEILTAIPLD